MSTYVQFCPRCRSTDIHVDFSNRLIWTYGLPPQYQCEFCGYTSYVFPEIENEKIRKIKVINTSPQAGSSSKDISLTSLFFILAAVLLLFASSLVFNMAFAAALAVVITNKIKSKEPKQPLYIILASSSS